MSRQVKNALRRMEAQRFPDHRPPGTDLPIGTRWYSDAYDEMESPSPRVPWLLKRRAILAVGLAALVGAGVLLVPSLNSESAYAATPPMLTYESTMKYRTAQEAFLDLALRAQIQPPATGSGPYHYLQKRGWYLNVAADTENRVLHSGIEIMEREQWIANDGSGRLKVTTGTKINRDEQFSAGGLPGDFIAGETTPESLRKTFERSTSFDTLRAVTDLWLKQVVPPTLQSGLLNMLATQPDLKFMGNATDRIGRRGVAIGAEKRDRVAERLILVFDANTGALLDSENIALERGGLPIEVPATVNYTVWIGSGYTTTTAQRP